MDAKHTPGPWVVGSDAGASGRMVGPMGEEEVCTVFGAGESNDPETRPECLANARLIAAAPEMLTVLKRMIAAFNADEIDPMVAFATIEQAQGTIARAEGKDGAV